MRVAIGILLACSGCTTDEDPWVVRPPGGGTGSGSGSGSGSVDAGTSSDGGSARAISGQVCIVDDLTGPTAAAPCARPTVAAPVTVTESCAGCGTTTTGSAGIYRLPTTSTSARLAFTGRADLVAGADVWTDGVAVLETPVVTTAARDAAFAALGWSPGGSLVIARVVDRNGVPLEGVTFTAPAGDVAADLAVDPSWVIGATTGPRGTVLFPDRPAGTTRVTARTVGGVTVSADVMVATGATTFVTLIVR